MQMLAVLALAFAVAVAAPEHRNDEKVDDKGLLSPPAVLEDLTISEAKHIEPKLTEQSTEEARHKKSVSTTTTFCVEVKPNNPYQKPYELCENGNEVYTVPADQHQQVVYNGGSGYNALASGPSQPATAPAGAIYGPPAKPASGYGAPAAAYSAPKNTYGSQAALSGGYVQSAPVHSAAYKTPSKSYGAPKKYRSTSDLQDHFESEEEEEIEAPEMRSAGYGGGYGGGSGYGGGYGGYGSGFGGDGLIKFHGKKQKKKGGHGGLVITCQPSLAGYATPVHAGGYGGGYGAYREADQDGQQKMRSTMEMEDPQLGRAYGYGNSGFNAPSFPSGQPSGFSGVPTSSQSYNGPSGFSGYGAPAHVQSGYGGFAGHGPAPHAAPVVHSAPAPVSFAAPTSYGAPTAVSDGYSNHASFNAPAPAPVGDGYSNHASFSVPAGPSQPQFQNFAPQVPSSQGYGAPAPVFKAAPQKYNAPSYQPQQSSYVAPGAYRSAENEQKEASIPEKDVVAQMQDGQTMETMKSISDGRSGSWSSKMRTNDQQNSQASDEETKKMQ